MLVVRGFMPLFIVLLGSWLSGCSGGESDEITPYITGFSVSPGTLRNEEILRVLEAAAKRSGLGNSGGAKVGHTIAPNLTLLASYNTDLPPNSMVWVTAHSPALCMEVETSVWGEERERRSPEITAALRTAVEQAFPNSAVSDKRCSSAAGGEPK
jgi:hypothetical protein